MKKRVKRASVGNPQQNDPNQLTQHHRKCRINGGKSNKRNISIIPRKQHQAWHIITGTLQPEEIAKLLNEIYLDPDYEFKCIKKS